MSKPVTLNFVDINKKTTLRKPFTMENIAELASIAIKIPVD